LVADVSGAGLLTINGVENFPVRIACKVKDFDPTAYMGRKLARQTTHATQFTLVAAQQALVEAGLAIGAAVDPERVGVVVNTGGGGMGETEAETRTLLAWGPGYIRISCRYLRTNVATTSINVNFPLIKLPLVARLLNNPLWLPQFRCEDW
jgi:3-oxoacyl-[acyl-carrier-protein] synthase II